MRAMTLPVSRPTAFLVHGGPGSDHAGLKARYGRLTDRMQLVYFDHRGQHYHEIMASLYTRKDDLALSKLGLQRSIRSPDAQNQRMSPMDFAQLRSASGTS